MGYDYVVEIVSLKSSREPLSGGFSNVSLGDIFSVKTKTSLMIVAIIIVVVIVVIVK
jgi:hypothetical protein